MNWGRIFEANAMHCMRNLCLTDASDQAHMAKMIRRGTTRKHFGRKITEQPRCHVPVGTLSNALFYDEKEIFYARTTL